ncbi:MAG: hypothetical protein IPF82_17055 [Blastocatellia bacterium]|nr:hypothetical protein [Blastocatellia bacterium]
MPGPGRRSSFVSDRKLASRKPRPRSRLEKGRLARREAELAALLAEAGAESVAAFRQKATAFAERSKLSAEAARCVGVLRTVSGCGSVEEVRAIYEPLTPDAIATEIDRLSAIVAGADAALDKLVKERADTDARIGQLRTAESVANARSVEERLLAQLRAAARDWMRHAVAGHLLDISQRRFEAERQPAVIKAASRYFATITSGRYERVVAPLDNPTIEVVAPDGRRTDSSNLSRGPSSNCISLSGSGTSSRPTRPSPCRWSSTICSSTLTRNEWLPAPAPFSTSLS